MATRTFCVDDMSGEENATTVHFGWRDQTF